MPSLVGKNIIRFDAKDFLAGLYAQYKASLSTNPNCINDQLIVANNFNPYRALGYASPGFGLTDLDTVSVMTGLGLNVSTATQSGTLYGYIISNNDRLNRFNVLTRTFTNDASFPHSIVGAGTETGSDCITYSVNVSSTRTPCVFYSWNDSGGAWNVGLFNTSAGTFDDDWLSTVPATPPTPAGNLKPHPMVIGADDVLYIGDGNKLHALDGAIGADGTFFDSVLTLPSDFVISSFAKNGDYLVIFGYYARNNYSITGVDNSSAFFYNYIDRDPTISVPIPGAVSAGFEYRGSIGCFSYRSSPIQGQSRDSTLMLWNGSIFEPVQQFIGSAPIHGGVDIVGNSIQWNTAGVIHSWGSPLIGAPDGLNKLTSGLGTSYGLLKTIGGGSGYQILCSGTTTTGGAQYVNGTKYATSALIQTGAVAPLFTPGTIGKVKRVSINFSTTASGGRSIDLYLIRDNNQTTQLISAQTVVTNDTLTSQFDRDISLNTLPEFREISIALQWATASGDASAPIVRYVDVEFDTINLAK